LPKRHYDAEMVKALCLIVAVGAACKGKEAKKQEEEKPAPVVAIDAATPVAPETPTAPTDERCASPCRFLADTPLADVAAKVKSTCNAEWPEPGPKDCAQIDYLRNCIYANAGYTFKKQQYQDAFGKESWYKARADFKEKDLSAIAQANIKELKTRAAECRKGGEVAANDKKAVDAWLGKLQAGKPPAPDFVVAVNEGVDPKEFVKGLVESKDQYAPKKVKAMRYIDKADLHEEWKKPIESKTIRQFVEVDFSDPGDPNCEGECGFGLWLTFAIDDKDKIVGIELQAAACPMVYVGDVRHGELLRNFDMPRREATQSLALGEQCGRVTVRIAEEKPETTYLDEVTLVVGDQVFFPTQCGSLCANDGRIEVLEQGASREVTFHVTTCGAARLVANGHYVQSRSKR
jgi:hypothetical protein